MFSILYSEYRIGQVVNVTWTLPSPGIFCTGIACSPDIFGIWMIFALAGRICCSACVGITVICWPCAFVMVIGCESCEFAIVWIPFVAFGTDWTSAFDVPISNNHTNSLDIFDRKNKTLSFNIGYRSMLKLDSM